MILHVAGREGGYFGWKGIPEVLPNLLPPVERLLNDYHHLLHCLVSSIYRTHQLLVLGPPRQCLAFGYSGLSETEVLSPGVFIVGEIIASLSINILPWVILPHPRLLPIGHDSTLADLFHAPSPQWSFLFATL